MQAQLLEYANAGREGGGRGMLTKSSLLRALLVLSRR